MPVSRLLRPALQRQSQAAALGRPGDGREQVCERRVSCGRLRAIDRRRGKSLALALPAVPRRAFCYPRGLCAAGGNDHEPDRLCGPHGGDHRRRDGHRPRRGAAARRGRRGSRCGIATRARSPPPSRRSAGTPPPSRPTCRTPVRSSASRRPPRRRRVASTCSCARPGSPVPTIPLAQYPIDDWQRVFDINVHGVFEPNRVVVP